MNSDDISTRRRNRPGEGARLRSEIVEAADALLAETGSTAAISLRGIARAVGITAPAIYAHFATKNELLSAVIARRFAGLAEALHRAAPVREARVTEAGDDAHDAIATVRARAHAYVGYGLEHPGHYAVLFGPSADHAGLAFAGSPGEDVFRALLDPVTAVAEARALETNPLELATDVWAALHGIVTLRAGQTAFPWGSCDEQIDRVVGRLLAS